METKTVLSIEELNDAPNVCEAIELAKSKYLPYPAKLNKPVLRDTKSLEAAKEYFEQMDAYHAAQPEYIEAKNKVIFHNDEINSVIVYYIKEQSGLYTIPKQYQDKAYAHAYSEGHSAGYYEVYQHLCELVDIFN